jgi:hypothetical protein
LQAKSAPSAKRAADILAEYNVVPPSDDLSPDMVDRAEDECSLPPTPLTTTEGPRAEKPGTGKGRSALSSTSKPAIVSGVGTLCPVAMTQRPAPPPKPKTRLRQPRGRFLPAIDSDSTLPYDMVEEDEDAKTRSQGSSAYTVSIKEVGEQLVLISLGNS